MAAICTKNLDLIFCWEIKSIMEKAQLKDGRIPDLPFGRPPDWGELSPEQKKMVEIWQIDTWKWRVRVELKPEVTPFL